MGGQRGVRLLKKDGTYTKEGAYRIVAQDMGLPDKDVKVAVEGLLELAAVQLKTNGSFNLANMFQLKVWRRLPYRPTMSRFMGDELIFRRPMPAKNIVRCLPTQEFKTMLKINGDETDLETDISYETECETCGISTWL